jgi:cytoskeletal protein CcmA (bactofilin family)
VGSIIVNGEVEGDIIATGTVELNAPAIIRGNITTPDLTMAKGVIFEGSCHMDKLVPQQEATVTVLSASKDS